MIVFLYQYIESNSVLTGQDLHEDKSMGSDCKLKKRLRIHNIFLAMLCYNGLGYDLTFYYFQAYYGQSHFYDSHLLIYCKDYMNSSSLVSLIMNLYKWLFEFLPRFKRKFNKYHSSNLRWSIVQLIVKLGLSGQPDNLFCLSL